MTRDEALARIKAAEDQVAPIGRAAMVSDPLETPHFTPDVQESVAAILENIEIARVELEDADEDGGALEPRSRAIGTELGMDG